MPVIYLRMKRQVDDIPKYTWLTTSVHNPEEGHEEDYIIRKNPTLKYVDEIRVFKKFSIIIIIRFGRNNK